MDSTISQFIAQGGKEAAERLVVKSAGVAPFAESPFLGYRQYFITDFAILGTVILLYFVYWAAARLGDALNAIDRKDTRRAAEVIHDSSLLSAVRGIGAVMAFATPFAAWGLLTWACPQFAGTFAAYADENDATVRAMVWVGFVLYLLIVTINASHDYNVGRFRPTAFLAWALPVCQIVATVGLACMIIAAYAVVDMNKNGYYPAASKTDAPFATNAAAVALIVIAAVGVVMRAVVDMVAYYKTGKTNELGYKAAKASV